MLWIIFIHSIKIHSLFSLFVLNISSYFTLFFLFLSTVKHYIKWKLFYNKQQSLISVLKACRASGLIIICRCVCRHRQSLYVLKSFSVAFPQAYLELRLVNICIEYINLVFYHFGLGCFFLSLCHAIIYTF